MHIQEYTYTHTYIHTYMHVQVRALRAAKFTCAELASEAGYSVKELVASGFLAIEMVGTYSQSLSLCTS